MVIGVGVDLASSCNIKWCHLCCAGYKSFLEKGVIEGDNPVCDSGLAVRYGGVHVESGCLGMQPKVGGKLHLKLNTCERPIANKYRKGKMQRTLKRELKRA